MDLLTSGRMDLVSGASRTSSRTFRGRCSGRRSFAGVLFLVAHGGYMLLSAHRKRPATETDNLEAERQACPSASSGTR